MRCDTGEHQVKGIKEEGVLPQSPPPSIQWCTCVGGCLLFSTKL